MKQNNSPKIFNEITAIIGEEHRAKVSTSLISLFSAAIAGNSTILLKDADEPYDRWVADAPINTLQIVEPGLGKSVLAHTIYNNTAKKLSLVRLQDYLSTHENDDTGFLFHLESFPSTPEGIQSLLRILCYEHSKKLAVSAFSQTFPKLNNEDTFLSTFFLPYKWETNYTPVTLAKDASNKTETMVKALQSLPKTEYVFCDEALRMFALDIQNFSKFTTIKNSESMQNDRNVFIKTFMSKCPFYLGKLSLLYQCLAVCYFPELMDGKISIASYLMAKNTLSFYMNQFRTMVNEQWES